MNEPYAETTWRVQLEMEFESLQSIDLSALIPALHQIIQQRGLDETWIDVVDYRHVDDGPSLLLVAHDAYYGVEHNGHRSVLFYRRRRPIGGRFAERLVDSSRRLLSFAARLAKEEVLSAVEWHTDRWTLTLQDRLLAPADPAVFAALETPLRQFQKRLLGDDPAAALRSVASSEPFAVDFQGQQRPTVEQLLRRLTSSQAEGQDAPAWATIAELEASLVGSPS